MSIYILDISCEAVLWINLDSAAKLRAGVSGTNQRTQQGVGTMIMTIPVDVIYTLQRLLTGCYIIFHYKIFKSTARRIAGVQPLNTVDWLTVDAPFCNFLQHVKARPRAQFIITTRECPAINARLLIISLGGAIKLIVLDTLPSHLSPISKSLEASPLPLLYFIFSPVELKVLKHLKSEVSGGPYRELLRTPLRRHNGS